MIYGGLVFLWACLEVEQRDRTWSKLWVPLAEAGYAVRYTQACSAARSLRAQAEQQPSLWRTALRGEFHPHPPCTYQVLFTVAYFSWPEYFVCFVAAYVALIALILKQTWRAYLRYVAEVGTAAGHYQRTLFRYARGSFECFGCCSLAALLCHVVRLPWCCRFSFGTYAFGFLALWVPENALCPFMPIGLQWLNLHAW